MALSLRQSIYNDKEHLDKHKIIYCINPGTREKEEVSSLMEGKIAYRAKPEYKWSSDKNSNICL